MRYLLDTNVISEPTRPRPDSRVIQWFLERDPAALFVSSITLAEIWQGIWEIPRSHLRLSQLESWATELPGRYRVLSFDGRAARAWGQLVAAVGRDLPFLDSLLSGVALSRGLILVTRNEDHFLRTGVKVFNPWNQ